MKHTGFYTQTPSGHITHIHGDPNMIEETLAALTHMMDLAAAQIDAGLIQPKSTVKRDHCSKCAGYRRAVDEIVGARKSKTKTRRGAPYTFSRRR